MITRLGLFDPLLSIGPLWLAGLLIFFLCLLVRELGARIYRWEEKRLHEDAKVDGEADSQITGAIFGLLAFILAFTFSIALERFDTRRGLVVEEANAIGTTYLRASLFDEPGSSRIRATLREYAHSRISPSEHPAPAMAARLRRSRDLRDRFWEETRAAVYPVRQTEQASYFLETANNMIELATRREIAGRATIPSRILDVTLLYLFVSAGMLGYLLRGRKGARRNASSLLLFLFSVVMVLILDIDRPRSGTIQVPQLAMEELAASLDRDAARAAPAIPAEAPPP
jgi:hypothetical protein